jgi:phosphonate transport system substrate-binding protein
MTLRVIWQSPLYVDYVWAVQSSMTKDTRRAIKEVFLTLSQDDPVHARFLDAVGANYFIPAHTRDFEQLTVASQAVEDRSRARR